MDWLSSTIRAKSSPTLAITDQEANRTQGITFQPLAQRRCVAPPGAGSSRVAGGGILAAEARIMGSDGPTRREAISAMGVVTTGFAIGITEDTATAAPPAVGNTADVHLRINGKPVHFTLDPRVTVLDLLREQLGLTGTKKGCDHGQCGACTVLANGRRINSCLSLVAAHEGEEITTVEGLAAGGKLHPVQAAFIEHDGFQCGYCTPGQICSAVALISEAQKGDASWVTRDLKRTGPADLSDEEISERMSGNLCRCGAYPGIVQAVRFAMAHETRP